MEEQREGRNLVENVEDRRVEDMNEGIGQRRGNKEGSRAEEMRVEKRKDGRGQAGETGRRAGLP